MMADSFLEQLFASGQLQGLLTPEERSSAGRQGLLSAGATILANSGPGRGYTPGLGELVGRGILAGQQGYQSAVDQSIADRETLMKLQQAAQLRQAQQAAAQDIAAARAPAQPATAGAAGGMSPVSMQPGANGVAPAPALSNRNKVIADAYRSAADRFAAIDPAKAKQYLEAADKYDPQEEYGNQAVTVMQNGVPTLVRLGKYGTTQALPAGVTPGQDAFQVDGGDRILLVDKNDPTKIVAAVPKGFSPDAVLLNGRQGVEANQTRATKAVEAAQTAQSAIGQYDAALTSINELLQHPGLAKATGARSALPTMPGSDAANFEARLETLKSQTFLPMVQALRGMGALSNAEGDKLTAAIGALDKKQSPEQFQKSLGEISSFLVQKRQSVANNANAQIGALTGQVQAGDVQVPGQRPPANNGATISPGTTRNLNGTTYRFDGTGWLKVGR